MANKLLDGEAICAISTARGRGAIAMIRVSGLGAIEAVERIYKGKSKLCDMLSGAMHYGCIVDGEEVVDYVMVVVFRSPRSYTGEDMVEVHCHGGEYIQVRIVQLLSCFGVRYAVGGEFTRRAFLHGKMDLTQAEAVADLIDAESAQGHRLAIGQLRGGVSAEIAVLRERMVSLSSLLEVELDFSEEEDVRLVDRDSMLRQVEEIKAYLASLLSSFRYGNAVKDGIRVVIVGMPNAGKSTLLNALLNEERAIVSAIPGTTRDTIEDTLMIDGYKFRIVDTAGIRVGADEIESEGVERAKRSVASADVLLHVSDVSANEDESEIEALLTKIDCPVLHIWNKVDLLSEVSSKISKDGIYVSLTRGETSEIRHWLVQQISVHEPIGSGTVITSVRHYDALHRCLVGIERVEEGLHDGRSNEFVSIDMRESIEALGEITGKISTEDILEKIFSKFCIGK